MPIDNKNSHLYNYSDWSCSNSCTLDWYTFLAFSSCSTHFLYLFKCSFVFGELSLFKFTLIYCISKAQLTISCWSKDTMSGWLPSMFTSGNFHTTCTIAKLVGANQVQMKCHITQKFHCHIVDYAFLIPNT